MANGMTNMRLFAVQNSLFVKRGQADRTVHATLLNGGRLEVPDSLFPDFLKACAADCREGKWNYVNEIAFAPFRFFLDLDFLGFPLERIPAVVKTAISVLRDCVPDVDESWHQSLICMRTPENVPNPADSTQTLVKNGVHVIFPRLIVDSAEQARLLRRKIVLKLKSSPLVNPLPHGTWKDIVDANVYDIRSKSAHLRLIGSGKAKHCNDCRKYRAAPQDQPDCQQCGGTRYICNNDAYWPIYMHNGQEARPVDMNTRLQQMDMLFRHCCIRPVVGVNAQYEDGSFVTIRVEDVPFSDDETDEHDGLGDDDCQNLIGRSAFGVVLREDSQQYQVIQEYIAVNFPYSFMDMATMAKFGMDTLNAMTMDIRKAIRCDTKDGKTLRYVVITTCRHCPHACREHNSSVTYLMFLPAECRWKCLSPKKPADQEVTCKKFKGVKLPMPPTVQGALFGRVTQFAMNPNPAVHYGIEFAGQVWKKYADELPPVSRFESYEDMSRHLIQFFRDKSNECRDQYESLTGTVLSDSPYLQFPV